MNEALERALFTRHYGEKYLTHECSQAVAEALWGGWLERATLDHIVNHVAKGTNTAQFAQKYLSRYEGT